MKKLNHTEITLLKLAIEGAEIKVVPQFLSQKITPKIICLEIHTENNNNPSTLSMLKKLNIMGYQLVHFEGHVISFLHKNYQTSY